MAPEVMDRRAKGDMRADMWAMGVMLADALLDAGFAADGAAADCYGPQDRKTLVPDAVEQAGAPNSAMVHAIRELLAIDPSARPPAADVLRQPGVFEVVTCTANQQALAAAPAHRRATLDAALNAVRKQGQHKLGRAMLRTDVLPRLVPLVNGMSAKQLAMDWEVGFEGESAQVKLHVAMVPCLLFARPCTHLHTCLCTCPDTCRSSCRSTCRNRYAFGLVCSACTPGSMHTFSHMP